MRGFRLFLCGDSGPGSSSDREEKHRRFSQYFHIYVWISNGQSPRYWRAMHQFDAAIAKPVSVILSEIVDKVPARGLTLRQLLNRLGERGQLIFCMILTIPFLLPVSIPGFSAPFGMLMVLIAVGLTMQRSPWLPNRLMNRRLAVSHLVPLLERGARLFARLERVVQPRLLPLTHRATVGRFNVMLLGLSGLLLMLPLPLPLANALPAYGVLCLAMGSLERDGYAILAGYVMVLLTIVYFGGLALLGGVGASALGAYF